MKVSARNFTPDGQGCSSPRAAILKQKALSEIPSSGAKPALEAVQLEGTKATCSTPGQGMRNDLGTKQSACAKYGYWVVLGACASLTLQKLVGLLVLGSNRDLSLGVVRENLASSKAGSKNFAPRGNQPLALPVSNVPCDVVDGARYVHVDSNINFPNTNKTTFITVNLRVNNSYAINITQVSQGITQFLNQTFNDCLSGITTCVNSSSGLCKPGPDFTIKGLDYPNGLIDSAVDYFYTNLFFTKTATATRTCTITPSPITTSSRSTTLTCSYTPTVTRSFTPTTSLTVSLTSVLTFTPSTTRSPSSTPTLSGSNSLTGALTKSTSFTVSGTPQPTHSVTFTPTPRKTSTLTTTGTKSQTKSFTDSATASLTSSITSTSIRTRTRPHTPTANLTLPPPSTFTASDTFTATMSYTASYERTASQSLTGSMTLSLLRTRSSTASGSFTFTPTSRFTLTPSGSVTCTPLNTGSVTPTLSKTSTLTLSLSKSRTLPLTFTLPATWTPSLTSSSTLSETWPVSTSPTLSVTFSLTDTATTTAPLTLSFSLTPTLSETSSASPWRTVSPSLTNSVTESVSSLPTLSHSFTPTQSYTVTFSPTDVLTALATLTPTLTSSFTETVTLTLLWSKTPSATLSLTLTLPLTTSISATLTRNKTFLKTFSPSLTPTSSGSNTLSASLTARGSRTSTVTPTRPNTLSPTSTTTGTLPLTFTSSLTLTPTITFTVSPLLTISPTFSSTLSLSFTPTSRLTAPLTLSYSPTFTQSPSVTDSITRSLTLAPTFTPQLTDTGSATLTPTMRASVSSTPSSTLSATLTPLQTLTGSESSSSSLSGSLTPTDTATLSKNPSLTSTSSATLTETLTDRVTETYSVTDSATLPVTATFTDTASSTGTTSATVTLPLTKINTETSSLSATTSKTTTSTGLVTTTVTDTCLMTRSTTSTDSLTDSQTASDTFTKVSSQSSSLTNTAIDTLTLSPSSSWTPTTTSTLPPTFSDTGTETVRKTDSLTSSSTRSATTTTRDTVTPSLTTSETLTLFSTPTTSLSTTGSKSGTLTGPLTISVTDTLVATDSVTATESLTQSTTLSDTLTKLTSQSASLTDTLTDTLTLSTESSLTPSSTATPLDTPSYTVTDTKSKTTSLTPTLTESSTGTNSELTTETLTPLKTTSASTSLTGSKSATFTLPVTSTTSVTLTPSGSPTMTTTTTLTPTGSSTLTLPGSGSSSVTTTLTATFTLSVVRSMTSSSTATLLVTLLNTLTRSQTFTSSLTPRATASFTGTESSSATRSLTDIATVSSSRSLTATDSFTFTEPGTSTITATPQFSASLTSTMTRTTSTTLSSTLTKPKSASSSVTTTSTDTLTLTSERSLTPTTSATLRETLSATLTETEKKTFTITSSLSASGTKSSSQVSTLTLTESLTDSLSRSLSASLTGSATVPATDTVTDTLLITTSPTFTLTDTTSPTATSTHTLPLTSWPTWSFTPTSTLLRSASVTSTWSVTAYPSLTNLVTLTMTSSLSVTDSWMVPVTLTWSLTPSLSNSPTLVVTWTPWSTLTNTPSVRQTPSRTPTETLSVGSTSPAVHNIPVETEPQAKSASNTVVKDLLMPILIGLFFSLGAIASVELVYRRKKGFSWLLDIWRTLFLKDPAAKKRLCGCLQASSGQREEDPAGSPPREAQPVNGEGKDLGAKAADDDADPVKPSASNGANLGEQNGGGSTDLSRHPYAPSKAGNNRDGGSADEFDGRGAGGPADFHKVALAKEGLGDGVLTGAAQAAKRSHSPSNDDLLDEQLTYLNAKKPPGVDGPLDSHSQASQLPGSVNCQSSVEQSGSLKTSQDSSSLDSSSMGSPVSATAVKKFVRDSSLHSPTYTAKMKIITPNILSTAERTGGMTEENNSFGDSESRTSSDLSQKLGSSASGSAMSSIYESARNIFSSFKQNFVRKATRKQSILPVLSVIGAEQDLEAKTGAAGDNAEGPEAKHPALETSHSKEDFDEQKSVFSFRRKREGSHSPPSRASVYSQRILPYGDQQSSWLAGMEKSGGPPLEGERNSLEELGRDSLDVPKPIGSGEYQRSTRYLSVATTNSAHNWGKMSNYVLGQNPEEEGGYLEGTSSHIYAANMPRSPGLPASLYNGHEVTAGYFPEAGSNPSTDEGGRDSLELARQGLERLHGQRYLSVATVKSTASMQALRDYTLGHAPDNESGNIENAYSHVYPYSTSANSLHPSLYNGQEITAGYFIPEGGSVEQIAGSESIDRLRPLTMRDAPGRTSRYLSVTTSLPNSEEHNRASFSPGRMGTKINPIDSTITDGSYGSLQRFPLAQALDAAALRAIEPGFTGQDPRTLPTAQRLGGGQSLGSGSPTLPGSPVLGNRHRSLLVTSEGRPLSALSQHKRHSAAPMLDAGERGSAFLESNVNLGGPRGSSATGGEAFRAYSPGRLEANRLETTEALLAATALPPEQIPVIGIERQSPKAADNPHLPLSFKDTARAGSPPAGPGAGGIGPGSPTFGNKRRSFIVDLDGRPVSPMTPNKEANAGSPVGATKRPRSARSTEKLEVINATSSNPKQTLLQELNQDVVPTTSRSTIRQPATLTLSARSSMASNLSPHGAEEATTQLKPSPRKVINDLNDLDLTTALQTPRPETSAQPVTVPVANPAVVKSPPRKPINDLNDLDLASAIQTPRPEMLTSRGSFKNRLQNLQDKWKAQPLSRNLPFRSESDSAETLSEGELPEEGTEFKGTPSQARKGGPRQRLAEMISLEEPAREDEDVFETTNSMVIGGMGSFRVRKQMSMKRLIFDDQQQTALYEIGERRVSQAESDEFGGFTARKHLDLGGVSGYVEGQDGGLTTFRDTARTSRDGRTPRDNRSPKHSKTPRGELRNFVHTSTVNAKDNKAYLHSPTLLYTPSFGGGRTPVPLNLGKGNLLDDDFTAEETGLDGGLSARLAGKEVARQNPERTVAVCQEDTKTGDLFFDKAKAKRSLKVDNR